jgi:branched-subunit amino acid aminotransferase/4-amino-4-deoxychorismate lyase
MPRTKAYRNGQLIEADQLAVSATDLGFMWGITVAEQLRTFGGQLFRCEQHLQRLFNSLAAVDTRVGFSKNDLAHQANHLVELNRADMDQADDLCLVIFATPGSSPAMGSTEPLLGMHTYPVPFAQWAEQYETGVSLVTSTVRQITPDNWPPHVKCRSRMHYFLADLEVKQRAPDSRALLLDSEGFVCEASTANVIAVFDNELVSPRREKILPGVSLGYIDELAAACGLSFDDRDLTLAEVSRASELLLTSTPFCLLPVTQLDDSPIGNRQAGVVCAKLLSAWSQDVGLDIREQALQFRTRT